MPTAAHTFRSLALAETPDDGDVSAPFEVLRAGDFDKRDLKVTTEQLDAMVANFKRTTQDGHELPVDVDHSFAEGGTSRAVGWFKELYRKGSSLFARVKWTAEARREIAAGHFRYFSAEFHTDWEDEHGRKWGPTLLAGALTNRPFVRGMTPVALSDDVRETVTADVAEMRTALDELADAAAERRAVPKENNTTKTETAAIALTDGAEIKIGDQTVKVTAEHLKLLTEGPPEPADESDTVKSLRDDVTALSGRVTAAEKAAQESETQLLHERRDSDLAQARREGRIDAKDETTEKWNERYEKWGRDAARELLFEMPAETIAMSERGHGSDKPHTGDAPAGFDQERHALHERTKAIAAEKDIPYEQALALAAEERS